MTRDKIRKIVDSIELPRTNANAELSSADGFAFLGCARALLDLDPEAMIDEVRRRDYRLNQEQEFHGGVCIPAVAYYVYTLWACFELFRAVDDGVTMTHLVKLLDGMQYHTNGLIQYCSCATNYVVPNAAACAARMYDGIGRKDKCRLLLCSFLPLQDRGNWHYFDGSCRLETVEDSAHLGIILYTLGCLGAHSHPVLSQAISESRKAICRMNSERLDPGSTGWGPPFVLAALHDTRDALADRACAEVLSVSVKSPNFRARAVSAWALALRFSGGRYVREREEEEAQG